MSVVDNKCPACGAKITFNPKNQKWDCEYCGSKFTLEEMQKHNNASSEEANEVKSNVKVEKIDGLDVYRCKNCGAEIVADENTTATFCVYCGSTAILKSKIDKGVVPSFVIPFKNVKEDAVNAFKKVTKGKILMPKAFKDEKNIQKITGVYISLWAYDFVGDGEIVYNASDVRHWSDTRSSYTETRNYLTTVSGHLEYEKVLSDASTRFDDDLMDSLEPFDLSKLEKYNHAYLSGFLSEKYDVEEKDGVDRASKRAMNSSINLLKTAVRHQISSVSDNKFDLKKKASDYILLPVWMVNIKYKDKMYTFAMNGETGKIVGNIPVDIVKAIIVGIIVFMITFAIVSIIMVAGGVS